MALVTRLKKNKNVYEIIIIDHTRSPSSGKIKQSLGYYNPHKKIVTLNLNKFIFWIANGIPLTKRIEKLMHNQFNLLKGNE